MELAESTLNQWKKAMDDEYGIKKYLSKDRDVMISALAEMLKERGVSLEDALDLKRHVKKFLVTDEGRKGRDRHKGWEESVEIDFDAAILQMYPPEIPLKAIKETLNVVVKEDYGYYPFVPKNAIITAWAMDRFGVVWNEKINLESHRHEGKFNEDFRKEVMESEWARTGENLPKWYEDLIS